MRFSYSSEGAGGTFMFPGGVADENRLCSMEEKPTKTLTSLVMNKTVDI